MLDWRGKVIPSLIRQLIKQTKVVPHTLSFLYENGIAWNDNQDVEHVFEDVIDNFDKAYIIIDGWKATVGTSTQMDGLLEISTKKLSSLKILLSSRINLRLKDKVNQLTGTKCIISGNMSQVDIKPYIRATVDSMSHVRKLSDIEKQRLMDLISDGSCGW